MRTILFSLLVFFTINLFSSIRLLMDLPFSLLSSKWILINRADGLRGRIAPYEITSDYVSNPVVSFAWARPDFDLAAHEFLIGLLAVAFPPKGQRDWIDNFHSPPGPEKLQEAFQPYAAAFSLDAEGPRFLQDFSPKFGSTYPLRDRLIKVACASLSHGSRPPKLRRRKRARVFRTPNRCRHSSACRAASGLFLK